MKMWEILERTGDEAGFRGMPHDESGMRTIKDKIEEAYKCGYKEGFAEAMKETNGFSGSRGGYGSGR